MTIVDVGGHQLKLSNLDKVLFPSGFTKGEVIDYYARIAPVLVPHLEGRPLTLKRYPNGSMAGHFFEKNCPKHRPEWFTTAPVASSRNRGTIEYCVVDSVAGLVWVANLASLELHPSLSLAPAVERPTMVVFDLDPGAPAGLPECREVALHLRDVFDHLDLRSVVKTSGSKGLQVYVPLNTPATYEGPGGTKGFALAVAQLLERQLPDLVVSNMAKDLRVGKVLVDWSQNDEHKTTVSVYSLRAKERPTVSTPVSWDEVDEGGDLLRFEAGDALERVDRLGDLFRPALDIQQELPRLA
ncbi:MAG TPA: non-homologous end-joining DNA ligase [Acidimicrobiales bacterium]|nr:non-homologous end-joining DNA ligase [Acidimicrobiales bacterium]